MIHQHQRVLLSLVCALALVLIPVSLGAQSSTTQDRTDVNQGNQNVQGSQDLSQDQDQTESQIQYPATTPEDSDVTREKPSPSTTDPNAMQNREQTGAAQTDELPATAGELPLLALIGILSLAAATGIRFGRSTR